jgi:DNA-directed RNA polymerase specialized sigma24 family protein
MDYREKEERLCREVQRLKDGNQESYNEIYSLSADYIYKMIYELTQDVEASNGIINQVYSDIYYGISGLTAPEHFYAWAGQIATTDTVRYMVRQGRFYVDVNLDDENVAYESVTDYCLEDNARFIPESILSDLERQRLIREYIEDLSLFAKSVVQYYFYENLSVSYTAQLLGCDYRLVKKCIYDLKCTLIEMLGYRYETSGEVLFDMASLPIFWLIFKSSFTNIPVSVLAAGTSLGAGAVAGAASGAAGTAVASGSAGVLGNVAATATASASVGILGKVAIATVATALVGGGTVAMVHFNANKSANTTELSVIEETSTEQFTAETTEMVTDTTTEMQTSETTEPETDETTEMTTTMTTEMRAEMTTEVTTEEIETSDTEEVLAAYQNYIDTVLSQDNGAWVGYSLIYVDDDDIPELVAFGNCEATGNLICTYYDGQINQFYLNRSYFAYLPRQNKLCNSGGNMDVLFDYVYEIKDGNLVSVAKGDYGAEDNSNVQIDENGDFIYRYYWNGEEVSKEQYSELLDEVFDYDSAVNSYDLYEGSSIDELRFLLE